MTIQQILSHFENVKGGGENKYTARCPSHRDKENSLSLMYNAREQKTVLHCHAGCNYEEVLIAAGLEKKDLFDNVLEKKTNKTNRPTEFLREHVYKNDDGTPFGKKIVKRYTDKKGGKTMYWLVWDDGQFVYKKDGLNGIKPPIFNAPQALAEKNGIMIAEGEKDADTLCRMGYCGTSFAAGGGTNFKPEHEKYFKDKHVVILLDNDETGEKMGNVLAPKLIKICKSVKVIPAKKILETVKPKGDITDIAEEVGLEQAKKMLIEAIKTTPFFTMPASENTANKTALFESFKIGKFEITETGVFEETENGINRVFNLPIYIKDVLESDEIKANLRYFSFGEWQETVFPLTTIFNATKVLELSKIGININSNNSKTAVKYFSKIYDNLKKQKPAKAAQSLGWCEDADGECEFLPYSSKILHDNSGLKKNIFKYVTTKGNETEQIKFLSEQRKNFFVRTVINLSLSAVLIELLNLSTSYIVNLWGKSQFGKTHLLKICASVWGEPGLQKLVQSANSTLNSIEETATILKNIPIIYDEINNMKSNFETYEKLIYRLCGNISRGRLKETVQEWNTIFIFSNEEPILDYENFGDGAKTRTLEIEISEKISDNFYVFNELEKNYGFLGKKFVETAKKESENLKDFCNIKAVKFAEKNKIDMRLSFLYALIVAADLWFENNILQSTQASENNKIYAEKAGKLFIKDEENKENKAQKALEIVKSIYLSNNKKFDFVNLGGEIVHVPECWGKIVETNTKQIIYFDKNNFVAMMKKQNCNFDAYKREWAQIGVLQCDSKGNFSQVARLNKINKRCVVFVFDK